MGLILGPIFLGAIIIVGISVFMISTQITAGTFHSVNIIYGILVVLISYGLIVKSYLAKEESWGLNPFFKFPLYMIYVPFLIVITVMGLNHFLELNDILSHISDTMLISVVFSAVLMLLFNKYFFNIIEKIGSKKTY